MPNKKKKKKMARAQETAASPAVAPEVTLSMPQIHAEALHSIKEKKHRAIKRGEELKGSPGSEMSTEQIVALFPSNKDMAGIPPAAIKHKFSSIFAGLGLAAEKMHQIATTLEQVEGYTVAAETFYEVAIEKGYIEAVFSLARMYIKSKNPESEKKAFELVKNHAEKTKNPELQFILAGFYVRGVGISKKNNKKAIELLTASANAGYVPAKIKLVVRLYYQLNRENFERQIINLLNEILAVSPADETANFIFGHCCRKGFGIDKDKEKAILHFQKAAEPDGYLHLEATYNLALMYLEDRKNTEKVVLGKQLLEKVAVKGMALASARLGILYFTGAIFQRDCKQAVYYLKQFHKLRIDPKQDLGENPQEYIKLIDLYLGFSYIEIGDIEEGIRLCKIAASQGNAAAQYKLALFFLGYQNGQTVRDEKAGLHYLRLAANQRYEESQSVFAHYSLLKATSTPNKGLKDEAINWLKKAITQKSDLACEVFLEAYSKGIITIGEARVIREVFLDESSTEDGEVVHIHFNDKDFNITSSDVTAPLHLSPTATERAISETKQELLQDDNRGLTASPAVAVMETTKEPSVSHLPVSGAKKSAIEFKQIPLQKTKADLKSLRKECAKLHLRIIKLKSSKTNAALLTTIESLDKDLKNILENHASSNDLSKLEHDFNHANRNYKNLKAKVEKAEQQAEKKKHIPRPKHAAPEVSTVSYIYTALETKSQKVEKFIRDKKSTKSKERFGDLIGMVELFKMVKIAWEKLDKPRGTATPEEERLLLSYATIGIAGLICHSITGFRYDFLYRSLYDSQAIKGRNISYHDCSLLAGINSKALSDARVVEIQSMLCLGDGLPPKINEAGIKARAIEDAKTISEAEVISSRSAGDYLLHMLPQESFLHQMLSKTLKGKIRNTKSSLLGTIAATRKYILYFATRDPVPDKITCLALYCMFQRYDAALAELAKKHPDVYESYTSIYAKELEFRARTSAFRHFSRAVFSSLEKNITDLTAEILKIDDLTFHTTGVFLRSDEFLLPSEIAEVRERKASIQTMSAPAGMTPSSVSRVPTAETETKAPAKIAFTTAAAKAAYKPMDSKEYQHKTYDELAKELRNLANANDVTIPPEQFKIRLDAMLKVVAQKFSPKFAAFINQKGPKTGDTALHNAVRSNRYQVIDILLSRRADITCQNNQGQTAADLLPPNDSYRARLTKTPSASSSSGTASSSSPPPAGTAAALTRFSAISSSATSTTNVTSKNFRPS